MADLDPLEMLMAFRAADRQLRAEEAEAEREQERERQRTVASAAATASPTASAVQRPELDPFASSPLPSPPSPPRSPVMPPPSPPIEDTAACGIWLRRALVAGTLSQEAQQALMRMSELRKGLVSNPVPLSVRKAIVNARLNPGLKSVLISELLQSSAPPKTDPSPLRRSLPTTFTIRNPVLVPKSQLPLLEGAEPDARTIFRMRRSKPSEIPGRPPSVPGASNGPGPAPGPPDRSTALPPSSPGPAPSIDAPSSSGRAASTGVANGRGPRNEWPSRVQNGMPRGHDNTESPERERKRKRPRMVTDYLDHVLSRRHASAGPSHEGSRMIRGSPASGNASFQNPPRNSASSNTVTDDEDSALNGSGNQGTQNSLPRILQSIRTKPGRKKAGQENTTAPPQAPSSPTAELTAENGRLYNEWWLADGTKQITYGTLLPTDYQPQIGLERPWVCPLRSCRVMFHSLQSLGGHFSSGHRAMELNDNGDGTFSFRGHRAGIGKLRPKVISKDKLDPNEPPMPEPCLPLTAHIKARAAMERGASSFSRPSTAAPTVVPTARTRDSHDQQPSAANKVNTTTETHPHVTHTPVSTPPSVHEPRRLRSDATQHQPQKEARNTVIKIVTKQPTTSFTNPAVDDTPDMAMEDWEMAPGRMRNSLSGAIENVAFSGPYLRRNEETSIDQDDGAHILVVNQGASHSFQALTDRKRKCWVASGKVRVKMREQEFEAGPDTLVLITPGTTCVVENCWYSDAKLFVNVSPGPF